MLNGQQQIYLAFKGTDSPKDLKIDFYEFAATLNKELNIKIHRGMNDAFQKVQKRIIRKLFDAWSIDTSAGSLIITGHSLGGGLAQILGAYLKDDDFLNREVEKILWNIEEESCWNCFNGCYLWCMNKYYALAGFKTFLRNSKIYTFGSPQVFRLNEYEIPQWKNSVERSSFHFVNGKDPVPLLNLLTERGACEAIANGLQKDGGFRAKLKCVLASAVAHMTQDCYWKEWGRIFYFNLNRWEEINLGNLQKTAGNALNYTEIVKDWRNAKNSNFAGILQNINFHFLETYKNNFKHL